MYKAVFVIFLCILLFTENIFSASGKGPETSSLKRTSYTYSSKGRIDPVTGVLRAQYVTERRVYAGTPEQIARQYLSRHYSLFGLSPDTKELSVQTVQTSPGGQHVRFTQTYNDIPVYGGDVVVSINKGSEVTFVVNNSKKINTFPSTQASLSPDDAASLAFTELQADNSGTLTQSPKLVLVADEDLQRLAYRLSIVAENPRGDWEYLIDAENGAVLQKLNRIVYDEKSQPTSAIEGSGYVFNPNPLITAGKIYGSTGLKDNNNATSTQLDEQRLLAPLHDLTLNGSTVTLTGPFVTIEDWQNPPTTVITASHPDSFRFHRNETGFEDVNVYFHIDSSQRYIQSLGFDNIQNLPMSADAHGMNSEDNSAFYPSLNALSFGDGGVDDAEDAEVILHEYGHAIQEGTVHGWGGGEEEIFSAVGCSKFSNLRGLG